MRILLAVFFFSLACGGDLSVAAPPNFVPTKVDTNFTGNSRPWDVHATDMDADADVDIVAMIADFGGSDARLVWYRQDPGDVFTEIVIDTNLTNPGRLDVGFVDNDLAPDIVVEAQNAVFWYKNVGATFTRAVVDSQLVAPRHVLIANYDDDGDNDVIILVAGGVLAAENDGFEVFTRDTIQAADIVDDVLCAADFDNDNDTDILTSIVDPDFMSGDVWLVILENFGNTFFRQVLDVHTGETFNDGFAADINKDGLVDFTIVDRTNNRVFWHRNDGGLAFTFQSVDIAFNQAPARVWVADIDNDADRDLLAVGGNSAIGEVVAYENDGALVFGEHTVDATAGNRVAMHVADIDANFRVDVVVANNFPHEIVLYRSEWTVTGINDQAPRVQPRLAQNVPNAFSRSTEIRFELPRAGAVSLDVYSVDGRLVRRLAAGYRGAGPHRITWDGRDDRGRLVASGVYFYRLSAGGTPIVRKMVLAR